MTTSADDGKTTGPVLELRVHGVNNTSPAGVLDLPADTVEEVLGDNLAGFWRPKLDAGDSLHDGDRGWVPPEVTREAYSWGGLARTSPGGVGSGTVNKVTTALGRIGWALLLPFGLANVAYWTRRLGDEVAPDQDDEPLDRITGIRQPRNSAQGGGASTVRLFGLGLTLLGVATACELSMDLIGKQCYHDDTRVCGQLPGIFDVLASHPPAVRLALTSLGPVVLLIGLWLLSSVTRARYERVTSEGPSNSRRPTARELLDLPVLARPHFWLGDRMVSGLGQLHLAAGFAVVALNLGWVGLFGNTKDCEKPVSLLHGTCWTQVGDGESPGAAVLFALCTVAALLVLIGAGVVTWQHASDAPDVLNSPPRYYRRTNGAPGELDRRSPKRLRPQHVLIAAGVTLVIAELSVLIVVPKLSSGTPLPGMRGLPTLLLAALFSLVAGAFTSRLHRWGPFWAGGLFLAFLFVGVSLWFGIVPVILLGGLATHVGSFAGGVRGDRRWTAWAGTGPGMFLGAALLVQGLLSSFAVLGAGDWLNGKNSASSLIDGCKFGCPSPNTPLQVPMPYVLIGTAALLGLVFLVVVIAGMLFRSRKAAIGPAPVHDYVDDVDDVDDVDAVAAAHVEATLLGGRRLAARAHRAEKTVAFLVLSGLTTMLVVLLYAVNGSVPWHPEDAKASFVRRLTDLGTAGVSFLALALLAAVVGGAAGKRPLGLIWDLICFLPRAAHPFGPPCYAERAVPELSSRVEWWLDKRPVPSYGHRRRGEKVVLSAHSLGGVLAVATLLARLPRGGWPHHEVRLLTYGSQLRAYFSRIFPELLGPTVLGTPPARAAQFWAPDDPWSVDANDADRPPPFDPPRSIVAILTTDPSEPSILRPPPGSPEPDDAADDTDVRTPTILWRNLWRRTDYLGMPVWSYRPDGNPIDHGAEEIDHTGYLVEVKTHGDYPRSAAYQEALIELAD